MEERIPAENRNGERVLNYFLDTSMVVRYLTGDSPELAEKAAKIIDSTETLYVTDVVIVETAYVLTSVYEVSRSLVVNSLIALLQKNNIAIFAIDKGQVLHSLLLCRSSGRISFGDALIWAAARSAGDSAVYTLDARFPDDGIEIRRE
jgi:predicted nucleic acid-binding protein